MLEDLFNKKKQYGTVVNKTSEMLDCKPNIPSGMWIKCDKCGGILYKEDLEGNKYVCTKCNYSHGYNYRN